MKLAGCLSGGATPRGRAARPLAAALLLASAWVSAPASAAAPASAPAALPPGAPAAAQDGRADYRIEARLDEETYRIQGNLELTYANRSGEAIGDLWFHLYLNAFANNRTLHMKEAGGKLRGVEIEDGWSWSEVRGIEVAPGPGGDFVDVFSTLRHRHVEGESPDDRTVFSVDLPRELEPGGSVVVRLEWECQLPRVRRRTGYKGDFLLVAQWFPKLGVYEPGRGWNCRPFHAFTEFYSDYGTYDVLLDLPAEYEGSVFASGVGEESREGGRIMVRFKAPSEKDRLRPDAPLVHDFTWTADPDFVVRHHTFDPAEWFERFPGEVDAARKAFGPDEPLEMRRVDVTALVQPEHAGQASRHIEATCAALFFYGLWFGEYPYQHVTVVDPAWGASAAGGMEYPTLFTCGTRLFTTEDMHRPESVTVHECGHQFFYGLVGNNEFEAAWLDEGLNSYADSEVLWRVYGARRATTTYARLPIDGIRVAGRPGGDRVSDVLWMRRIPVPLPFVEDGVLTPIRDGVFLDSWREKPSQRSWSFLALYRDQPKLTFARRFDDPRWSDRAGYLGDPETDPIETNGWEYADARSYSTNSYRRTAVALRSLEAVIGRDAFLRGMRRYARDWRYRHPYPADFYRTFEEGAGADVGWYFRELFQSTAKADWSVEVDQERRPEPRGFFQAEGGQFLERTPEPVAEGEEDPRPWRIEVLLRRKDELSLPMPVLLAFEDGSTRELVWTREEQMQRNWKRIELETEVKLVSVQLDPERGYYLDGDMSNNSWYDRRDRLAPWRWAERALAQYQRYLHWIAGVGG